MADAPVGQFYDVPDEKILLHRSGSGGPAVVFLAGGGALGLYYWNVQQRAAEFTTSVTYDRLGTGWSDPVPLPRTGTQVTDDLHELLRAAAVPGPYVLVGHSLGGLYARLYAKRFPNDVAGLVLLDPTPENLADYLPEKHAKMVREFTMDELYPPDQREATRALLRTVFLRGLADFPAEIREPAVDQNMSLDGFQQTMHEISGVPGLYDEVPAAGPDPEVPTIYLAAMGTDAFAPELSVPEAAELNDDKFRCYTDAVAALSDGELRRLDDTGHMGLPWVCADAVVKAIHDVLGR